MGSSNLSAPNSTQDASIPMLTSHKPNESENTFMMRVQIYTNDRDQPIDLEVLEVRTQAREITTNENGQHRVPDIDQTLREVIRDSAIGASANLLFTTPDGREGAIYLDTEKVAAIITSWISVPSIEEPRGRSRETTSERAGV
jgi:hypothetical protein